jgi:predicted Zn-ribbon and HTH transcriptional regulator
MNELDELKSLLRESSQAQMYNSERIRNIKFQELDAKAHFFGYSFDHWKNTGTWRKYTELKNELDKPVESVETRKSIVKTEFSTCLNCGSEFRLNIKNKIFCCEKCKGQYHYQSKKVNT